MWNYHSPVASEASEVKDVNPIDYILTLDLAISLIVAFQDSKEMAAHNLINMYIGEDFRNGFP